MDIFVDSEFAAAHRLPETIPGHKCSRLHGHTFLVRTIWRAPLVEPVGWVADFDDVKKLIKVEILDRVDHNYLNEVKGLENPTSENLAIWIWNTIKATESRIARILVEVQARESCTTGAIYRGPETKSTRAQDIDRLDER